MIKLIVTIFSEKYNLHERANQVLASRLASPHQSRVAKKNSETRLSDCSRKFTAQHK